MKANHDIKKGDKVFIKKEVLLDVLRHRKILPFEILRIEVDSETVFYTLDICEDALYFKEDFVPFNGLEDFKQEFINLLGGH